MKYNLLGGDGVHNGKLNSIQKLLVGALAGTTSVVFTYPLDFARGKATLWPGVFSFRAARLTVQGGISNTAYKGITDVVLDVCRTKGVSALFHGMVPTLIGVAPYVGVNYLVYESLKEMAPSGEKVSATWLGICGGIAGTTGQTVAYPMDLLRRRFQVLLPSGVPMYSSVWNGIRTIVAKEGLLGLYKGFGPNFVKVVPTIAVMFWSNDMLLRYCEKIGL